MTTKELKKLLPRGIKHLSVGHTYCTFIHEGQMVTVKYHDFTM